MRRFEPHKWNVHVDGAAVLAALQQDKRGFYFLHPVTRTVNVGIAPSFPETPMLQVAHSWFFLCILWPKGQDRFTLSWLVTSAWRAWNQKVVGFDLHRSSLSRTRTNIWRGEPTSGETKKNQLDRATGGIKIQDYTDTMIKYTFLLVWDGRNGFDD